MYSSIKRNLSFLLLNILMITINVFPQDLSMGLFEGQNDIGNINNLPGGVVYNKAKKTYTISGSGVNMWFTHDAFHYVWKKVSGNISIAADIKWIGNGVNPHRKACLIIRQGLEANSPYADVAVHGDGLTSLQYREEYGSLTREIQSNVKAPKRVLIEREGDYIFMSVAGKDGKLHPAGGSFRLKLNEPFYIGLGVCSHDSTVIEKAIFSNVKINYNKPKAGEKTMLESTLETIAIASKDRRVIFTTQHHIEAPNWSRDGKYFIYNSNGLIYKLPVLGGEPQLINTGSCKKCNNDHGISPDGTQLVISDQSNEADKSMIYILPSEGGTPRLITQNRPSYWHGWSPDGKTLAYCAERNGQFDIYTIPVEGGQEKQLTNTQGLDDGPDYSPDGKYIYFNSNRTGQMQIWRMKPDGSDQEQITSDEYNNWFAHPSPDGKWFVFLSYEKDVDGHPANRDVMLRLMNVENGEIQILAKLFGGQGTINVPSWSPDSNNLAFVSYRLINQ